ncbi:MAG: recombinase family protein, partial [Planctomycetes bacterium]|nr:recombinase family protein [Planctomycetota bacterium]
IIRVSTRKQRDNNSPSIQRDDIEAYAERHGLRLIRVAEIHESAKIANRRHKFQEVLEQAKAERIQHVICWRFDRHTRNFTDLEAMQEDVRAGVFSGFHVAHEDKVYHKRTPGTEWITAIVQTLGAKQYSEDVTERAITSTDRKAADGWYPGHAPVGYVNIQVAGPDGRVTGRHGRIQLTDQGRTLIRRMYELRLGGMALRPIADT